VTHGGAFGAVRSDYVAFSVGLLNLLLLWSSKIQHVADPPHYLGHLPVSVAPTAGFS
jgi:hypothetical protein